MKVAFATDGGRLINTHFGHCQTFMVYEITTERFKWLETRKVVEPENNTEASRIEARLNTIMDCTLVFVTAIGASAAARVTRNKIMPVKVDHDTEILQQLDRLLDMLRTKPPLWLVRALKESEGSGKV